MDKEYNIGPYNKKIVDILKEKFCLADEYEIVQKDSYILRNITIDNKKDYSNVTLYDNICILSMIEENTKMNRVEQSVYILKRKSNKVIFKELTGIDLDNYEIGESEQMSYNGVMSYHSLEYIVDFVIDGGEFNILKQENPITGIPNYILTMRYVNDNNKPTIVSYLFEFNTESFINETMIDLNKYELDSIISYEKEESKFSYDEPQDTTLEELIKNFNNKKYTNIRTSYSVNDKQYTLSLKNIDNNEYYTYTFKHK